MIDRSNSNDLNLYNKIEFQLNSQIRIQLQTKSTIELQSSLLKWNNLTNTDPYSDLDKAAPSPSLTAWNGEERGRDWSWGSLAGSWSQHDFQPSISLGFIAFLCVQCTRPLLYLQGTSSLMSLSSASTAQIASLPITVLQPGSTDPRFIVLLRSSSFILLVAYFEASSLGLRAWICHHFCFETWLACTCLHCFSTLLGFNLHPLIQSSSYEHAFYPGFDRLRLTNKQIKNKQLKQYWRHTREMINRSSRHASLPYSVFNSSLASL